MTTYRDVLKEQFHKRVNLNTRYSLRAFAALLSMQPSTLSDVFNEKKGVSPERAIKISGTLSLTTETAQIFILSARSLHARSRQDRLQASLELKKILADRQKSAQRNAWYFGAVKAFKQSGVISAKKICEILAITELQVESATRFINRIKKYYPERTAINYEPTSLLRKIQDAFIKNESSINFENDFLFLTEEEIENLRKEFRSRSQRNESSDKSDLYMITLTDIKLT